MPKIDIPSLPVHSGSSYPEQFRHVVQGRERQRLGDAGGLQRFGVNLTRLKPGAASALRHWHEVEEEMVYILRGEVVLVEDDGESPLRAGDCAVFKPGVANGHHLVNRSDADCVLLEIGTRPDRDVVHYSDADLVLRYEGDDDRFTRRSGEPYDRR